MPREDSFIPVDDDGKGHKPIEGEFAGQQPIIDSGTLFQGAQELLIQHNDQIYRLRQTRNGKLILNK